MTSTDPGATRADAPGGPDRAAGDPPVRVLAAAVAEGEEGTFRRVEGPTTFRDLVARTGVAGGAADARDTGQVVGRDEGEGRGEGGDEARGPAEGRAVWVRVPPEDVEAAVRALCAPGWQPWSPGVPGAARPRAKVERLGRDWLVVRIPTIWYTADGRDVTTGSFDVVVGPDVVVTAESGRAHVHERVLARLDGHLRGGPVQRVVTAVVIALVGAASDVELALTDAVADVERLVFDEEADDPVSAIYDLKREITEARRALMPIAAEVPELADETSGSRVHVDPRALERLVSTVERIDRHLDADDDLLSDMLSVHLTQVSVQQNEDMRKISAWAAILVFPTIVGGIYGMNFRHMPELAWYWGYPLALGVMAGGCVVLYRWFRRAGWL